MNDDTPKFKQVATGAGPYGSVIVALGYDDVVYQWNKPRGSGFIPGWSPLLNEETSKT